MDLTDITATLAAKSDQLNAEDLAGGPMTAQIERVTAGQDHPIAVYLVGNPRPWYPCKTVRRLLVACWSADATTWAGRWVELYREDSVVYAGKTVGGIRLSGASHIDGTISRTVQERRGRFTEYKIKRLTPPQAAPAIPSKSSARDQLAAALKAHDLTLDDLDGWAAAQDKPTSATMDARTLGAVAAMITDGTDKGAAIVAGIREFSGADDGDLGA